MAVMKTSQALNDKAPMSWTLGKEYGNSGEGGDREVGTPPPTQ